MYWIRGIHLQARRAPGSPWRARAVVGCVEDDDPELAAVERRAGTLGHRTIKRVGAVRHEHQGEMTVFALAEGAEQPGQINALTIVPVKVMDRAGLRALAYAAALGQPAFALHISPTAEEADRFLGYWRAWGDHLPLEVIVSPHRAVVAPLVNYLWTLHEQRPDLILTVAVPELVDRHCGTASCTSRSAA